MISIQGQMELSNPHIGLNNPQTMLNIPKTIFDKLVTEHYNLQTGLNSPKTRFDKFETERNIARWGLVSPNLGLMISKQGSTNYSEIIFKCWKAVGSRCLNSDANS